MNETGSYNVRLYRTLRKPLILLHALVISRRASLGCTVLLQAERRCVWGNLLVFHVRLPLGVGGGGWGVLWMYKIDEDLCVLTLLPSFMQVVHQNAHDGAKRPRSGATTFKRSERDSSSAASDRFIQRSRWRVLIRVCCLHQQNHSAIGKTVLFAFLWPLRCGLSLQQSCCCDRKCCILKCIPTAIHIVRNLIVVDWSFGSWNRDIAVAPLLVIIDNFMALWTIFLLLSGQEFANCTCHLSLSVDPNCCIA